MKVLWWNVCHVSNVWSSPEFWQTLAGVQVAFLTETHHTFIPCCPGWQVVGLESEIAAGGVLALVSESCHFNLLREDHPYKDCLWLLFGDSAGSRFWLGGSYIPGPSDQRFRSRQGFAENHFSSLARQIDDRAGTPWIAGGDYNCITMDKQPDFDTQDPSDHIFVAIETPKI